MSDATPPGYPRPLWRALILCFGALGLVARLVEGRTLSPFALGVAVYGGLGLTHHVRGLLAARHGGAP